MARQRSALRRWLDLKQGLYRRLQPLLLRLPAFLGRRLSRPQSAYIKLTLRCNARCLHCDVWKRASGIEEELSTEEWKQTLASIRRWLGPTHVCLTGGEVLLRPDALDLLECAAGQGHVVQFLTNGYAVTDAVAERIMGIDPDTVAVSLDATDPELYDRLRGRAGFFERAAAGIRALVHHHRQLDAAGKIIVKTVIMEPTLHEMTKVLDWVEELGTAQVFYQPITQNYEQEPRVDWYHAPGLNALWVKDGEKGARVMDALIARRDAGSPIANSRHDLELTRAYFLDPASWSRNMAYQIGDYSGRHCPSGVGVLDIAPDGDVRTCPMSEPIGNVRRDSLPRLWRRRGACWKRPCPYW